MSKIGKIILWIVIIVIVAGGIWWWMMRRGNSSVATPVGSGSVSNMTAVSSTTASTSYPQGDSDQAINQDMTNLNTQMNGLSSDNASVTQSLNDQPVQQAE